MQTLDSVSMRLPGDLLPPTQPPYDGKEIDMETDVCRVTRHHQYVRLNSRLQSWHTAAILLMSAVMIHAQYTYRWVSSDGNPNGMSATVEFMYPDSSLVPPDSPTEGIDELMMSVPGLGNFSYTPADGALTDPTWSPRGIESLYFVADDPYGVTFTQGSIDEIGEFPFRNYSDTGTWVLNAPDVAGTGAMLMMSFLLLCLFCNRLRHNRNLPG